jgi:outer membrane protein assembly factor BamB
MPWIRSLPVLLLTATLAAAGDWPQWLGPQRDCSSPETVAAWTEAPHVLWRQPVGEGNSSPVVANGLVYLHSKIKDRNEEEVAAFDARTGKEAWRYPYKRAAFSSLYGNGPRATPAVVDSRVYTFGITGVLNCLEARTGKLLWSVDTLDRFKAKNLFFGLAGSPLVEGDHVLINVGAEGASIVAFDRKSGEVAWKSQDDKASYSSPIVFTHDGVRQAVFLTAAGLVSVNPADGKLWWRYPLVDKLLESSTTPTKVGDYIIGSSITFGSACLQLQKTDGKPGWKEVWQNPDLTCYFSTPLAAGPDLLYMVTGKIPGLLQKPPGATLHALDVKTRKPLWSHANIGQYHAALVRTGNGKLLMLDDFGNLGLLEPSPKEYKELCKTKVCGPTWAHPALAHGKVYVRDDKELLCIQLGN